MSSIYDLLARTVPLRVREDLKPRLQGFLGMFIRAYFPQTFWVTTESGEATIRVEKSGDCQVLDGHRGKPDVSIQWTDEAFRVKLTTRGRGALPPGTPPPRVTPHTENGRMAAGQLGPILGI